MTEQPLVSVLMTAYNREDLIADAIESVLSSAYENFELVIVDDASTDKTVEIAETYRIKDNRIRIIVNEKNIGDYPNRNKAASVAKGKYIKYLDSDDIMYPHCLLAMVNCMEKFPEAGYGLSSVGDPNQPFPVCLSPHDAYMDHFRGRDHFNRAPGSAIINKNAFDDVGGFSGLRDAGDFEFWLKIACYYPLVKMPVDLYWSRIHEHQESKLPSRKQWYELRLKVLKDTISREKVPVNSEEIKEIISSFKNGIVKRVLKKITKHWSKSQ